MITPANAFLMRPNQDVFSTSLYAMTCSFRSCAEDSSTPGRGPLQTSGDCVTSRLSVRDCRLHAPCITPSSITGTSTGCRASSIYHSIAAASSASAPIPMTSGFMPSRSVTVRESNPASISACNSAVSAATNNSRPTAVCFSNPTNVSPFQPPSCVSLSKMATAPIARRPASSILSTTGVSPDFSMPLASAIPLVRPVA